MTAFEGTLHQLSRSRRGLTLSLLALMLLAPWMSVPVAPQPSSQADRRLQFDLRFEADSGRVVRDEVTQESEGAGEGLDEGGAVRGAGGKEPSKLAQARFPFPAVASSKARKFVWLIADGDGQVTLSWDGPGHDTLEEWKNRQRGVGSWGVWEEMSGSTGWTKSHTVTGLSNGEVYGLKVRGKYELAAGSYRAGAVSFSRQAMSVEAPGVPDNLSSEAGGGEGQVVLSWETIANNRSPVTRYQLLSFSPKSCHPAFLHEQGNKHSVWGEWNKLETERGCIQAGDAETLTLALEPNEVQVQIVLDRIQALDLAGSLARSEGRASTPADGMVDAFVASSIPRKIWGDFLAQPNQDKPHIDTGPAVNEFPETPDTLSQRAGLLDNLGIKKRIALKLGTGTLAGFTSSYTLRKILRGLGFGFFCDLYPYFFCGELIGLMTGTVIGVTLVDPHDNPFWASVGSGLGIAIGLHLAEKTDTIWPLYVGSSGGSTLLSELSRRRFNASRFSVGLTPDSWGYPSWIAILRF